MEPLDTVSLSTSLYPLPIEVRRGLIGVASLGIVSLSTTTGLFLFLSYRLLVWYRNGQLENGANQFFILVYNLLLADIQQALAFALTIVYVVENKIEVGSSACFAQAWFVSTGDLASGVFIFVLALHTFFAIVKGRGYDSRVFYTCIAAAWIFVYAMAIATIAIDRHIYVRAGAWCWIDRRYEKERLALHYIWIFFAMGGTIIMYGLIYFFIISAIQNQARQSESTQATTLTTEAKSTSTRRAAKYMIIYPVVYVVCTLPLAGGRMAAMTGFKIPYWYYCVAGAAITSCGWLDVLLYAMIRRVVIFSPSPPPKSDFGLNTFGWHHKNEFYGTITIIEGPLTRKRSKKSRWSRRAGGVAEEDELALNRSRVALRELRRSNSDENYFARPAEGVITTKTTVEVTRGQILQYSHSETSILGIQIKSRSGSPSLRKSQKLSISCKNSI